MNNIHTFSKKILSSFIPKINLVPSNGGVIGKKFKMIYTDTEMYEIVYKKTGEVVVSHICSYRSGLAIISKMESKNRSVNVANIINDDNRLNHALSDMKMFKYQARHSIGNRSDMLFSRYLEAKDAVRRYTKRIDRHIPHNIFID